MSIKVSSVDPSVDDSTLRDLFGEFGPIVDVKLERKSPADQGQAIVSYLRQSSAIHALSYPPLLNGKVLSLSPFSGEQDRVPSGETEGEVASDHTQLLHQQAKGRNSDSGPSSHASSSNISALGRSDYSPQHDNNSGRGRNNYSPQDDNGMQQGTTTHFASSRGESVSRVFPGYSSDSAKSSNRGLNSGMYSESHHDAPRGTKIFVGGLQCTQEEYERSLAPALPDSKKVIKPFFFLGIGASWMELCIS